MSLLTLPWGLRRLRAIPRLRLVPPRRENLLFPIPAPGRVAVLAEGFQPGKTVRVFAPDNLRALEKYAPETVVAPVEAALALAGKISSLNTALIILTQVGGSTLESQHREILWRAFGVPIFEQLRDRDGIVIARECEVRNGLHLDARASLPSSARIVEGYCDCGGQAPRLIVLAPMQRAAAAGT